MDILLTHGYFLYEDPHERQVMKPYPPLGLLYISSYLKQQGFNVGVFDTTFRDLFAFETFLQEHQPPVVGLYTNMMTKRRVLQMIRLCKVVNATVILGGPDPAYYAAEYLQHGADIIVRGEGEMTLEELLPHLAKHGLNQLESITGIVYMNGTGSIHETPPRVFISDLSANPWPAREAIDLP